MNGQPVSTAYAMSLISNTYFSGSNGSKSYDYGYYKAMGHIVYFKMPVPIGETEMMNTVGMYVYNDEWQSIGSMNIYDGASLIQYNANTELILNGAGIGVSMIDAAAALTVKQELKYVNALSAASTATKFAKLANVVGHGATAMSALNIAYQVATNTDNTSTWVDAGVTAAGVLTIGIVGVTAAPAVAVCGLVYGVWSIAGGSDWIDRNWGYRP